MEPADMLINLDEPILVTGAAGFIGTRVVQELLQRGFRKIRCLTRPSSGADKLRAAFCTHNARDRIEILEGNLLSIKDCFRVAKDVRLIYHLAAGTGTKAFSDAFLNSVVTTRNLLDATLEYNSLKRFVSLSSFAVYTNKDKPRRNILDESCPVESHPGSRAEAYCYGKTKQDELVIEYGKNHDIPFVLLRPGVVYGPGKRSITGRVGIDTFGIFLHFGGANPIPLTYVENCSDAIVLAGLKKGIEGEVFNIVDDDLPRSRSLLRMYKKHVKSFRSVYVPKSLSYLFCWCWEKYSEWSHGQLPPVFTRREWTAYWAGTQYSNQKLKTLVGWAPKVSTAEGLRRFFESCRQLQTHA